MVFLLYASTGGESALQPHSCNINSGIQTVFFCLFYNAITGFDGRVCQLQLNGYLCGNIEILDLLRFKNLHHYYVFVSEAAIIDKVILPLKRMPLILQCLCHIKHLRI